MCMRKERAHIAKDAKSSIIREMHRMQDTAKNIRVRTRSPVRILRQGERFGWVELLVLRIYPARIIQIGRKVHKLVTGCGRDESGVTGIVLWNEDAHRVKQGDVIRIHDGWVRSNQGRIVLSAGRRGRIELRSTRHGSDISRMSCGRTWNRPPCAQ